MQLDRRWIGAHIPHAGKMCLLDAVLSWDAGRIECRTSTHRDADNPLRSHGRLGCACGVEYAAQAMAVHGALVGGRTGAPAAGYLVGVRRIVLHVVRLDDIETDLLVSGERIHSDETTVLYQFSVHNELHSFLSGRATVVLDAAALARIAPARPAS
jgi:predicted hotdog family 3-hydroxylacyl-ACP dehydratase